MIREDKKTQNTPRDNPRAPFVSLNWWWSRTLLQTFLVGTKKITQFVFLALLSITLINYVYDLCFIHFPHLLFCLQNFSFFLLFCLIISCGITSICIFVIFNIWLIFVCVTIIVRPYFAAFVVFGIFKWYEFADAWFLAVGSSSVCIGVV